MMVNTSLLTKQSQKPYGYEAEMRIAGLGEKGGVIP
jgi:hypothetical protein